MVVFNAGTAGSYDTLKIVCRRKNQFRQKTYYCASEISKTDDPVQDRQYHGSRIPCLRPKTVPRILYITGYIWE